MPPTFDPQTALVVADPPNAFDSLSPARPLGGVPRATVLAHALRHWPPYPRLCAGDSAGLPDRVRA